MTEIKDLVVNIENNQEDFSKILQEAKKDSEENIKTIESITKKQETNSTDIIDLKRRTCRK